MRGAIIRSYGLTDYLKPVIKQYNWLDKVLVMNHRFNGVIPTNDNTQETVKELNQPNVEIMVGEELMPHEVLNVGLDKFKEFETVFISDSDELICTKDQKEFCEGLGGFDVGICTIIDYAKDFNHRYPIRGHRPPVIVKPFVKFYDNRCYVGKSKHFPNILMHHLGYTYLDLKWKLKWEERWEGQAIYDLMNHPPFPYEMPEEIKEWLKQ